MTAIQELIEKLNNVKPAEFCSIETIKGWAQEMLEQEREQVSVRTAKVYAKFCVKCEREGLPPLELDDFISLYYDTPPTTEKLLEGQHLFNTISRLFNTTPTTDEMYEVINAVEKDNEDLKVTFTTTDPKEIKRLAKANDMALFIWELVHNGWREFKGTDYNYYPAWDKIHSLLNEHDINIDDLTG